MGTIKSQAFHDVASEWSKWKQDVIVPAGLGFNKFIIFAIVVAILYLSREILVPIALAGLLSFVLAPLVKLL